MNTRTLVAVAALVAAAGIVLAAGAQTAPGPAGAAYLALGVAPVGGGNAVAYYLDVNKKLVVQCYGIPSPVCTETKMP